ncbi:MAG TPA: CBS domain-containing protein, partial [Campylobacterales bacterium]|nr:CBS domain-containing protein [Campylobacterales bacterium]
AINLIQGKSLITAKTTDSLSCAASIMYKNKIGLLPLTLLNQVVGIISESDILRLIKRNVSFDGAAGEYMNTDILFTEEDSYSDDVLELMDERKVSHILVKGKNGEAIGALSKRDLIRNLKDNYQKILEKKLKNARDALSKLPNPIMELCRSDDNYYVS